MYRIFKEERIPQKIQLSMAMSIYAGILFFWFPINVRLICFLAMLISTLGDYFLNYKTLEQRSKKDFVIGAVFFMLAHVVYAIAFIKEIIKNNYLFWNIGAYVAVVILLVTLIAIIIAIITLKKQTSKSLFLLCFIYLIFIGINITTIFSFAISVKNIKSIVALGALSFYISDLFIGLENLLKIKKRTIRKLVWWFYPIGQILILTFA